MRARTQRMVYRSENRNRGVQSLIRRHARHSTFGWWACYGFPYSDLFFYRKVHGNAMTHPTSVGPLLRTSVVMASHRRPSDCQREASPSGTQPMLPPGFIPSHMSPLRGYPCTLMKTLPPLAPSHPQTCVHVRAFFSALNPPLREKSALVGGGVAPNGYWHPAPE